MIDEELQKRLIFEWLDALRSGTFRQALVKLETAEGLCCLGVACRVFMKCGGSLRVESVVDITGNYTTFDGHGVGLPDPVQVSMGLRSSFGGYRSGALYEDNDFNGRTFPEIADIIEANAEALFRNGATVRGWLDERKAKAS